MTQYLILVPVPGSSAARRIDAGSGIVCETPTAMPKDDRVLVYFEGNRYHAANLRTFDERVKCAAGRLHENYPTIARGAFPTKDFMVVGLYHYEEQAVELDQAVLSWVMTWTVISPAIFKQTVPCQDCPFRKEGGVRHSAKMLASYAAYFVDTPGATFPCHKSVNKDDPRTEWTKWQTGQVLCSGGLLFAAKQGKQNDVVRLAVANGWYDPAKHQPEELALVFDSLDEMVGIK